MCDMGGGCWVEETDQLVHSSRHSSPNGTRPLSPPRVGLLNDLQVVRKQLNRHQEEQALS